MNVLENPAHHGVQLAGLSKELNIEARRLDVGNWSHPERLKTLTDNTRKLEQVSAGRTEYLLCRPLANRDVGANPTCDVNVRSYHNYCVLAHIQ